MQRFTKGTRRVEVAEGERFAIELVAAAAGGYQWTLKRLPPDASISFERESYTAEGAGVGAPGTQTFLFKGRERGRTTLQFAHGRSWEAEPEEVAAFDVIVR